MVIKEIVQIGNPVLNRKSKLVKNIASKEIQTVVKNLVDSMRYHELIGMAASQIGEKWRVFVTEVRKTAYRNPKEVAPLRIYINPRIVRYSKKETIIYEACGSVAYSKLFAPVRRPETIEIEALDENGTKFRLTATGLLSRVIQHEYDHLEGKEFTERITDMRKIMSSGEYVKRFAKRKV